VGLGSRAALLIAQPLDRALYQSGQFVRGTVDGLVHGPGVMGNRDWLPALETGLHQAALVVVATLVANLVGQVNLDARHVFAEPADGAIYYCPDVSGERLVTLDVMVGIDLDLHAVLLLRR